MRPRVWKHIVGIATFLVVISTSVIYFTPKPPPSPGERFTVPPERLQYMEIKAPRKFKVSLNSIEYDEASQRFTAQLELVWDGTLPNPDELKIHIGVTTKTNGSSGRDLHSFSVARPFRNGSKQILDIGWKDAWFTKFYREPNYLAYADIEPYPDFDDTDLVFRERNYLLNAVPLAVVRKAR